MLPRMLDESPGRRLFLLRHGQYQGREEEGTEVLTALGRRQAEHVGRRLERLPFARIHCSPQPRARQTLEHVRPYLPSVPVSFSELLCEGIPSVAPHFPPRYRPSLAERSATKQRMDRAFERLFRPCLPRRLELVVAHGNLIRYLVRRALGDARSRWWQLEIYQCSLTTVRVSPQGRWLLGFNDVGHLPSSMHTVR